jgi:cell division protein FtsN
MGQNKTKTGETGKRYHFELSRTSIFFWSVGAFVLLAWIFTLGVLAGRGLLPGGVNTLAELKIQIGKLQQMISKKDRSELERIKELQKDPKFAFYDELSGKKSDTVNKPSTSPKKRNKDLKELEESKSSKALTKYIVQVASLDSEAKATKMVNRLIDKGYSAYSYKVFIKGRKYYRVRCGMFRTVEEAINIKKRLAKNEKLDGLVRKVERE